MARFPVYARHEDARCFNCKSPFTKALLETTKRFRSSYVGYGTVSRHPAGDGEFEAICPRCCQHSFYDLRYRLWKKPA